MFSVPYDLDPNTVEDVFDELGAYDIKKWRVFHFEGEYQEYKDGFNNIEIGKGYWLNAKNDLGVQIKPGKGEVTNYNQSSSFPMSLKQGWNQIGNPFPFIIDWTKVVGIDKTGPLSFYHDGAYDENQTTFGPWRGAFIHADEAVTLLIPVSAKASSSGRSTAVDESKPELDSDDWLVPIHVTIEGMQQNSGVGMNPKASASKDRFDRIAVPHFIDFAEMTTEHNEFFSPHFSRDVMPSISEYTWSFTVKSNLDNGQGQLAWDNQSIAHNSSSLVLIDRTESRWVDMKSQGSYSFTHHGERQIEIVYDRDGEINPGMTLLGDAYPNPFATTVTIPILVDEPGLQQIEFFDGLGRKVTQYTRWFETSGIHEFNCNWSEQSSVSAGLMYYKLTGTSSVKRLIKH
jgi:hypothetical protein